MKISVVTAVFNCCSTIRNAIESVAAQTHTNVEHILVDGMSTDGTSEIISNHRSRISHSVREPDSGIYDALNKGIRMATGDIIGFLHADDIYADRSALVRVDETFSSGNFDATYGDLTYVSSDDVGDIIRYWRSNPYRREKFRRGWMPPHPTVYIRKEIYEQYGGYRTDLGSAADYECLIRLFYRNRIHVGYIPKILVNMRVGGKSNATFRNRIKANNSDRKAWLVNGLRPPLGLRVTKPMSKLTQYIQRPSRS